MSSSRPGDPAGEGRAAAGALILEVRDVHARYGAVRALQGVSIQVPAGSCVGVVGANGAGKSTLAKVIAGLIRLERGDIVYRGERLGRRPAFRRVRAGIVLCPERRRLFGEFTVAENLAIATQRKKRGQLQLVYELFPILAARARQLAGTLSGGEQQMLAIGRALMSEPELFILDEPSLGLAPLIRRDVFATLTSIKARGCTVLIMEQNARDTLRVADYAYVLKAGQVGWEGRPSTADGTLAGFRDIHYAPSPGVAEDQGGDE